MGTHAYALAVLAEVEAVWASANVILPGLRYVHEGSAQSVSRDCEQVTVAVDRAQRGQPGLPLFTHTRVSEWSATVTIEICRLCVAVSEDEAPPLAADHDAASSVIHGDFDLLRLNFKRLVEVSGCQHAGAVDEALLDVQGGLGGSRLTATVDLISV